MKILVVEDDDVQRIFLQQIITKKLFCKFIEATDGLSGLRKVEVEITTKNCKNSGDSNVGSW